MEDVSKSLCDIKSVIATVATKDDVAALMDKLGRDLLAEIAKRDSKIANLEEKVDTLVKIHSEEVGTLKYRLSMIESERSPFLSMTSPMTSTILTSPI